VLASSIAGGNDVAGIPARLIAGDTLTATVSYADYTSGDGYALALVIALGAGVAKSIALAASGDDWTLTGAATETQSWKPGPRRWAVQATLSGAVTTIDQGVLEVLPSPLGGYDSEHVERVLAALEAVLEDRASDDQKAFTIGSRAIELLTPAELMEWRDRYRAELAEVRRNLRAKTGRPGGGRLLLRF
jgi:hypothetical protein